MDTGQKVIKPYMGVSMQANNGDFFKVTKDPHEGIVTKPPHYIRWVIEPIEFLYRNRVEGHIFNIVKYSMRAGHKLYPGMDAVQSEIVDLKKAARNIEMRINLLEGKEVL
jgi:hypothetical protein